MDLVQARLTAFFDSGLHHGKKNGAIGSSTGSGVASCTSRNINSYFSSSSFLNFLHSLHTTIPGRFTIRSYSLHPHSHFILVLYLLALRFFHHLAQHVHQLTRDHPHTNSGVIVKFTVLRQVHRADTTGETELLRLPGQNPNSIFFSINLFSRSAAN